RLRRFARCWRSFVLSGVLFDEVSTRRIEPGSRYPTVPKRGSDGTHPVDAVVYRLFRLLGPERPAGDLSRQCADLQFYGDAGRLADRRAGAHGRTGSRAARLPHRSSWRAAGPVRVDAGDGDGAGSALYRFYIL